MGRGCVDCFWCGWGGGGGRGGEGDEGEERERESGNLSSGRRVFGPELKPSDTCCKLEVTRGHCACVRALLADIKLADLEITVEA